MPTEQLYCLQTAKDRLWSLGSLCATGWSLLCPILFRFFNTLGRNVDRIRYTSGKCFFLSFFSFLFFTRVSWADHVMWLEAASAQDVGSGWRHRAWVYAWLGKRADGGMDG